MTAITFDTLQFANRLKNAGVPSTQAEAEASALAEVFSGHWASLATKLDVAQLEANMATKQDFAQLEANMGKLEANMATKQDFAQLEANMGKLEANMATKQDFARLEARIEQSEVTNRQKFTRLEAQIEQRATKADLAVLEARTKEEMGRLHGEILGLGHQMGMLRWMMGLMVAGIVSLMVKAFVLSNV